MPNYCNNTLSIKGPAATLSKVRNLVKGEDNVFDFDKIIPMPDYIYVGNLGPEERKIYGKNNWYDWSTENWGTKWNSKAAELEEFEDTLEYSFYTANTPCGPIIEVLAKMFPEAKFEYKYFEIGMCFCGAQEYENGSMVYSFEGEYYENYEDEES